MNNKEHSPTLYIRLTTILFCLALFGGLFWHVLLPDQTFSNSEKRSLEPFPPLQARTLADGSFMTRFVRYTNDQFPFREFFVGLKSESERALGRRDNGRVWFGHDGYLFERREEPVELDFQAAELKRFAETLEQLAPTTRRFLLVSPTATSLLPDQLPTHAQVVDQGGHLGRLYAAAGDYQIVSTAEEMAKDPELQYFYRNDHHWTVDGARAAYRAFVEKAGYPDLTGGSRETVVRASFLGSTYAKALLFFPQADELRTLVPESGPDPNDQVLLYEDERLLQTGLYRPDLLGGSDDYLYFVGQNYPSLKLVTENKNGRSLLLIKDSYANSVLPFLTAHYENIRLIDLRYYADDLNELMQGEGPYDDVLILYNFVTFSEEHNFYRLNPAP